LSASTPCEERIVAAGAVRVDQGDVGEHGLELGLVGAVDLGGRRAGHREIHRIRANDVTACELQIRRRATVQVVARASSGIAGHDRIGERGEAGVGVDGAAIRARTVAAHGRIDQVGAGAGIGCNPAAALKRAVGAGGRVDQRDHGACAVAENRAATVVGVVFEQG